MRSGTIIPIKLHKGVLSLLRAQHLPIKLEIFLSDSLFDTTGNIYLDDGATFRYRELNEKIYI